MYMEPETFAAVCAVGALAGQLSEATTSWTGQGSFKHQDD